MLLVIAMCYYFIGGQRSVRIVNNEVTNNLKLVADNLLFIYAYKSFLDPWWATLAAIWLNYPTCGHHVHQWILNQLSFLHGSACFKIEVWNNSPFAVGCSSMVLRGGGRLQESGIPYRPLYTTTALIKFSRIPSVFTLWLTKTRGHDSYNLLYKYSFTYSGVVNYPQHVATSLVSHTQWTAMYGTFYCCHSSMGQNCMFWVRVEFTLCW